MYIGMQIQTLRKQHDISQETLAAELGVTLKTLRKWEDSITQPNIDMIIKLADYFRVTTDELMGRDYRGIFMVCDPTLTAPILQYLLERENFMCSATVPDSAHLRRCLQKRIPNILFLEIHLPGENGLDLLKEMKEQYPSVRVIVVTESSSEETRLKAASLGADAYIVKPFLPEQLIRTLENLGFQ